MKPPASTSRPGFPFRRLLLDGLAVGIISIACGVIISVISEEFGNLGVNLVFSLTIGAIALLLIDGSRLLFWGDHRANFRCWRLTSA